MLLGRVALLQADNDFRRRGTSGRWEADTESRKANEWHNTALA